MGQSHKDRFFRLATVLALFGYPALFVTFLHEWAGAYLLLTVTLFAGVYWSLGLLCTLVPTWSPIVLHPNHFRIKTGSGSNRL